jgi:surface antigen
MANRDLTSLINTFKKFTLISIHDTLTEPNNNVNRIPFVIDEEKSEDYAIQLCNDFEKKYNKKLNYKIENGMGYFSLEEIK